MKPKKSLRSKLALAAGCFGVYSLLPAKTHTETAPEYYRSGYVPAGYPSKRMFNTRETQEWIREYQNVCKNATFMSLRPPRSGTGSTIHAIGAYLALAINNGYILYLPDGSLDNWECARSARNGHECFFLSLTDCTVDATSRIVEPPTGDVVNVMPHPLVDVSDDGRTSLPVNAPLGMPDTPDRQVKYWWRAQASAYIMRLNEATSSELKRRRALLNPPYDYTVHIRRGEKGREMKLYPAEKFFRQVPRNSRAFIITEDSAIIREAKRLHPGRVEYIARERTNADVSTTYNDMVNDFAALWISLESTHFVGSLGSNWARLTDELRRVWVAPGWGCCSEYTEVGCEEETCPVNTYNW